MPRHDTHPLIALSVKNGRLSELVERVGWETIKSVLEVRRTLQRFGTEAGREVLGQDVWVDAAMRQVDLVDGPVVITD